MQYFVNLCRVSTEKERKKGNLKIFFCMNLLALREAIIVAKQRDPIQKFS